MYNISKAVKFFEWWSTHVHGERIDNETFDLVMERFKRENK